MEYKFNQTLYSFAIPDNKDHGLQILHYQSNQYAFDNNAKSSQNYCIQLTCFNSKQILLRQLINKKATLIIYHNSETPIYHHGIITHCSDHQNPQIADHLTLYSPLYPLTLNIQQRIYHNVTLPELIKQLLTNVHWQSYEYQLVFEKKYPSREYVVQYQESDYDFLQRKCAFYGVFFTFIQKAEHAILIFSDNIQNISQFIGETTLSFHPVSSQLLNEYSVFDIEWHQYMITDNIIINDYNYRTPDVSLFLESTPMPTSITHITTDYRFQDHYKTLEEGHFLLHIRQQALDCRRKIWTAKTDCVSLLPGFLLEINNHPIDSMNGDFIIIAITHYGDQSAAFPLFSENKKSLPQAYYNIVQLIPAYIPYRPTAPEPVYMENCLANITGTPSTYAAIDEHGRYLIKPKFDTSNAPDDQTSHAVRLIQPLSGNQYGAHFPLHIGTEVLLTHMNGDPDRPIIMGVLPNMNSLSPVTANNYTQNIMKTWGGNQLLLDDQPGNEHILLNTIDEQNSLLLDASIGQQQIRLQTLQGDMYLHAGNSINSVAQKNHQQIIGDSYQIVAQNQAEITTKQGNIILNAATDILLSANHDAIFNATHGNIIMQTGADFIAQVNGNINMMIENQDLTFQANNGNISLIAAGDIIFESIGMLENIYISQSGASIHISNDAITISSPSCINFEAEQILLEGEINYSVKDSNHISQNLILHFKDEIGEQLANLEGIYHLFSLSR